MAAIHDSLYKATYDIAAIFLKHIIRTEYYLKLFPTNLIGKMSMNMWYTMQE